MDWKKVAGYFMRPFPSMKGFSAYRMPGPMFHLSVAALVFVVGLSLCIPANAMDTAPLLAVWLIVGLYFGRDLAILAHYNGLLVIAWVVGIILVFAIPNLPDFLHDTLSAWSGKHYPEAPVLITAVLACAFALWVRRWIRDES